MLPINKRPDAQVDHVPGRAVVVAHEVEGHGNVGMAVVQTQIVLGHKRQKKRHRECLHNDATTGHDNKNFLTGLHLYSSDASCTALSQVAAPFPQTLSTSSFQYLQHE